MSQEYDPVWLSKANAIRGYSNYNVCVEGEGIAHTIFLYYVKLRPFL